MNSVNQDFAHYGIEGLDKRRQRVIDR